AIRVTAQPDFAEALVERVVEEVAPDEPLANPEDELQRFGGLYRPDHAREHTEHAGLRARRRELRRRRLREEAAVAGTFERLEHRDLALKPVDRAVHHCAPR